MPVNDEFLRALDQARQSSSAISINRHPARRERDIRPPDAYVGPLARSAPGALPLIGARPAAIHRLAAIASRNPLAIAPDTHRLYQRLMLESARGAACHCSAGLGVTRLDNAKQGSKQQDQDEPNRRFAHAPLPRTVHQRTECNLIGGDSSLASAPSDKGSCPPQDACVPSRPAGGPEYRAPPPDSRCKDAR